MPPLVWEKLRERKCSHLALTSAESEQAVRSDRLAYGVRCCTNDRPEEDHDVSHKNEVAAAKEIRVGSTDHERNRTTDRVHGREPRSLAIRGLAYKGSLERFSWTYEDWTGAV